MNKNKIYNNNKKILKKLYHQILKNSKQIKNNLVHNKRKTKVEKIAY